MSIIRKFKLNYDWKEFVQELDELFPLDTYEEHTQFPTPQGIYYHNIPELPMHLKTAIEKSIGLPIKEMGWVWDWRCQTTELLEHTDAIPHSEWSEKIFDNKNQAPITVNIAMENDFHLYVMNNTTNEYEHCIYGPGDIVMFNNNTQAHGGYVLNDLENTPRRSLNCYLDVDTLSNEDHDFWKQPCQNVPWPEIKTKIENVQKVPLQKVPLQKDYKFKDMAYLDSPEAYRLFELQADIIIEKQCKGIVDIGCRHGPVLQILHDKGYTDFKYMGFDSSLEPIELAQEQWKDFNNIEFRHGSWDNNEIFAVDFNVDQVIWSGVLLYRPDDHYDFFDKITNKLYSSPNAIIQEPMQCQRHWKPGLILNTIADNLGEYKDSYKEFKEYKLDLDIFAGRRLVIDLTL